MTIFLIICLALVALTLAVLLRPLLKRHHAPAPEAPTSQALSARVLKEQLEQLQADHASGQIDAQEYEKARTEVQARALSELSQPQTQGDVAARAGALPKAALWTLAVALPTLSFGMYFWLGSPVSLDPVATQKAQVQAQAQMINNMVERLAAKLKENPNDPEGWARLGRAYKVLDKYAESAQAYERALPYVEQQADLLIDYAEVLARLDDNDLNRRAAPLIAKAQKLDPQHPMALVLSGAAAYQRDDFAQAAKTWEKLIPLIPPDSADAKQVADNIAQAKQKAKDKAQGNSPVVKKP